VEDEDIPDEFSEKDEQNRAKLISEGFSKWTKKEFAKFLRACDLYGLNDYESISKLLRNKTASEVEEYVAVFKSRIDELNNGQRILSRINKYETEKNKNIEYQEILETVYNNYIDSDDVFTALSIPYKNKAKVSDR
jgi:SWI/SNF-related matrix-associated actin-dependent regulator of chromatin subfamily A member 5